jgi:hypothetical protein
MNIIIKISVKNCLIKYRSFIINGGKYLLIDLIKYYYSIIIVQLIIFYSNNYIISLPLNSVNFIKI